MILDCVLVNATLQKISDVSIRLEFILMEIRREFSLRDFLELEKPAFHRIVRRLRRKGKIMANPQITKPRFYFLTENMRDYLLGQKETQ
jgi:hypothetical protein